MNRDAHGLSAIAEVQAIARLTRGFARHPDQWNRPHEADAELVRLTPLNSETYLAATIDGVGIELAVGYFKDHFTAGWVLVQGALSDLAAVGAAPIGLLLAISSPKAPEAAERLREGIDAALAASGVAVLGGDLSEGGALTACALGLVEGRPVGRTGIRPGDVVWATGPLGLGNGLAIARMLGLPDALAPEAGYRPRARLTEGQALRPFAHAMIDTSDGPMSALDHLARLNNVGLRVEFDPARLVPAPLLAGFAGAGLPAWPLLCGELGEYELLVAAPGDQEAAVLAAAPEARRLAVATEGRGLTLALADGRELAFDGAFIRNLPARTGDDWSAYASAFRAFGTELGLP